MDSKIVVIDYGMGNVKSITNMLRKVGVDSQITSDPSEIKQAQKIIIPGVGAFDTGIMNLKKTGLLSVLDEKIIKEGVPVLGICLGMQLFAKTSEEGRLPGLGWVNAKVMRFNFSSMKQTLKVPHMGWNTVLPVKENFIFKDVAQPMRFYFVHSYHFVCSDQTDVLGSTLYGYDFPSVIKYKNIIGVQFHPEKSHKYGMQLIKNFVELY